jgi:hypothetical protein
MASVPDMQVTVCVSYDFEDGTVWDPNGLIEATYGPERAVEAARRQLDALIRWDYLRRGGLVGWPEEPTFENMPRMIETPPRPEPAETTAVPPPPEAVTAPGEPPADGAAWVLDDGTLSPWGPIESQLRRDIAGLKFTENLSQTLIVAAYAVAGKLDRDAGLATAAVARELREYVRVIRGLAGDSVDTQSHTTDLSTPV